MKDIIQENISQSLAFQIGKELFENYKSECEFPEDDWISISKNWDLNLWTDDGHYKAAIYPVNEDGDINVLNEIMISE